MRDLFEISRHNAFKIKDLKISIYFYNQFQRRDAFVCFFCNQNIIFNISL